MKNNKEQNSRNSVWIDVLIVFCTSLIVCALSLFITFSPDSLWKLITIEPLKVWGLFAVTLMVFFIIYVFLSNADEDGKNLQKNLAIVYIAVIITLGLVILSYKFVENTYVAPVTLLSIIVTVFIGKKIAVVTNGLFSVLLLLEYVLASGTDAVFLSNEVVSVLIDMLVGYFIVFFLRKSSSRAMYLATGVGISLLSAPLSFAGALLIGNTLNDALWAVVWNIAGNMIAVSIFLVFLPILEMAFRTYTDFKLGELCNFRAKILKELSIKAPGTFNHCIMVGVLAESCALAIGENPQLAKTCAYYHDVGKMKGPEFFAENQIGGKNPHDELIPEVSARKITSHTVYGYEMLKKRGYPEEIASVCLEHHGTMPVSYFYRKADKISDGRAELELYSYQGPKPKSKIAAIIMLCDASEAAVRAAGHGVPLEKVVDGIFKERMDYAQFDECPITIADLKLIKQTIIEVLSGVYHSRVSYIPKI